MKREHANTNSPTTDLPGTDSPTNGLHLPAPLHQYELFALLRILERHVAAPNVAPIGTSGPARHERLRLGVSTSLAFPAADLAELREAPGPDGINRLHLVTHFFGLVGSDSPLPASYATEVMHEEDDNPQMAALLDVFHHRFLSLLYRAWLSQRYLFSAEPGGRDPLSRALLSLVSITPETLEAETGIPPERLLRVLGGLLLSSRPPDMLAGILSQELGLDVRVRPLEPRRVPLEPADRFRLGKRHTRRTLHQDILVGRSMIDRTGHVVLRIGPVPGSRLQALAPGGDEFTRVVAFTRFYLQHPLQVTLELEVPASEMPRSRLGFHREGNHRERKQQGLENRLQGLALLREARTDPVLITFVCPEPDHRPEVAPAPTPPAHDSLKPGAQRP